MFYYITCVFYLSRFCAVKIQPWNVPRNDHNVPLVSLCR